MTDARLTQELAARVMGWRSAPGRYLISSDRRWIPARQFQPLQNVGDAVALLEHAGAEYALACGRGGAFAARVSTGTREGKASGDCSARVLTMALVEALGILQEVAE